MTIIPIKVSYDDKEWLYFDRYEEWSFSQQEIRTPHSDLSIYGAIELEQDGKTGIRLEIFLGLWRLDKLPCINKINSCTPISTIDITKHHGLPYLWIRMYNSDNKLVASFWGRDRDNCADNIIAYLNIMKATNNNRNKLV